MPILPSSKSKKSSSANTASTTFPENKIAILMELNKRRDQLTPDKLRILDELNKRANLSTATQQPIETPAIPEKSTFDIKAKRNELRQSGLSPHEIDMALRQMQGKPPRAGADIPGQMLIGAASAISLGALPLAGELISKGEFSKSVEPGGEGKGAIETGFETFGRRGAEFAGFVGGPAVALGKKIVSKLIPKVTSPLLRSAVELGIASSLSGNEALAPVIENPDFKKVIDVAEEKLKSAGLGAFTGGRFALIGRLPKGWQRAVLNIAVTQLSDHVMGAPTVAGAVRGDISHSQISDTIFNTMLDLWFSQHRTPSAKEIKQLRKEAEVFANKAANELKKAEVDKEIIALTKIGARGKKLAAKTQEQKLTERLGKIELKKAAKRKAQMESSTLENKIKEVEKNIQKLKGFEGETPETRDFAERFIAASNKRKNNIQTIAQAEKLIKEINDFTERFKKIAPKPPKTERPKVEVPKVEPTISKPGIKVPKKITEAPVPKKVEIEVPKAKIKGTTEPLPSIGSVTAKKQPDGKYKLFYAGTNNEVFPGKVFRNPSESKHFLKAEIIKRGEQFVETPHGTLDKTTSRIVKAPEIPKPKTPKPEIIPVKPPVSTPSLETNVLKFLKKDKNILQITDKFGDEGKEVLKKLASEGKVRAVPKEGKIVYRIRTPDEIKPAKATGDIKKNILERGAKTDVPEETISMGATLGPIKLPDIKITIGKKLKPKVTFDDPAKEAAWNEARGIPNKSIFQKIIKNAKNLKHGFTRSFIHIPNNDPFYAPAKEVFRQLRGSAASTAREALNTIKQLVKDIPFEDIDLATRKLKLEDYLEGLNKPDRIKAPFGFTEKEAISELSKIDIALKDSPLAQRLVDETRNLLDFYGKEAVKHGILADAQIQNKNYFRRQILKYQQQSELFQPGKKLKKPRPGLAKKRKGSELPDNTDYLQAMYSYMSDLEHDINIAKSLQKLKSQYDVSTKLKKQFGQKWISNIPEGYKTWQPELGNLLYKTNGISDKIANELFELELSKQLSLLKGKSKVGIEITADDLRQILAVGGKKEQWVIPDNLYNQLNDLKSEALGASNVNKVLQTLGIKQVTKAWKIWTLLSPKRWGQYNFRNLVSDAETVLAAQPKIFKEVPQATKELREYFFEGKPMSDTLREFNSRSGIGSTFVEVEVNKLDTVKEFEKIYAKELASLGDLSKEAALKTLGKAWHKLIELTQFREDILRYASYLHYREKALAGNLDNFGASFRKEILALKDPKDQAAKLARELLGDYDNISKFGEAIRNSLVPFYSWMEINAKRWPMLIMNSWQDARGLSKAKAPAIFTGKVVAGFYARVMAAYATTYVWNNYIAPQVFGVNIENELSEFDRNRLHISLGKHENGKVRVLRTPTATSDFLEYFGANEFPLLFDLVNRGVISIKDAAIELAKSPVKKIVNGINPAFKLPTELASGESYFPSVFEPSPITDKWDHFFRVWQVEDIYRKIKGIPQRTGLGENLLKKIVLITEYDANEIAYYDILKLKRDFQKKVLGKEAGFGFSERSQAFRNFKKARKFGQHDLAKALFKDIQNKGWEKNLEQSLKASDPLFGLTKEQKVKFVRQYLNGFQREKLKKAQRFYNSTLRR